MSNVGVDSYTLKMIEQATAPLRKIQEQVERTANALGSLKNLAMTAFAGGAVIGGIKLMSGALGALVGVMSGGAGIAKTFLGTVMDAAKFRQQNITAFEVLMGKGKGEAALQDALRLGQMTAASELDVVTLTKQLAGAGYSGGGLNRARAAALDVQGFGGNEAMTSFGYYLKKFKSGLSFEMGDLHEAAAAAGLQERGILTKAITLTGATPSTGGDGALKQMEKLKKSGAINGDVIIESLLQSVREKLAPGGGKLGDYALKTGMGSIAGLLSNLQDAPTAFLARMKLEDLPGIKSLMEFVKRILTFFDLGTEQGQKLREVVEGIINSLLGGLGKITSDDLGRFFESGLIVAKELIRIIDDVWKRLTDIIHSPNPWAAAVGEMQKALEDVGAAIGVGFIAAMRKVLPAFIFTDDQTAKENSAAVADSFDILKTPKARNLADEQRQDLQKSLRGKLGATTVNMGGVTVVGALNPEQARETAHNLTEAARGGNWRIGAVGSLGAGE